MLQGPFRGREAIERGLVTPAQLRGRQFHPLYRGVYLRCGQPLDLRTRSRAAFLLLNGTGALAGDSAAELLGASCAPEGAPAEIVAPRCGVRPRTGLMVHRDALPPSDITTAQGCRVTTPLRTAWDLARRLDRTEAVVALDALARRGRFDPAQLLARRATIPGSRHARRLDEVVALAEPRAESPMESRLRLLLHDHGLPTPTVQFELYDRYGFVLARFDLAYPAAKLAIEYDGESYHRSRRGKDNHRDITAAVLGWETMRVEASDVWVTPRRTADAVARLLAARSTPR